MATDQADPDLLGYRYEGEELIRIRRPLTSADIEARYDRDDPPIPPWMYDQEPIPIPKWELYLFNVLFCAGGFLLFWVLLAAVRAWIDLPAMWRSWRSSPASLDVSDELPGARERWSDDEAEAGVSPELKRRTAA